MSARNSVEANASVLRFWGVRGSIPTPGAGTVRYGGNTSCVEVRLGGELLILDAGTGIRLLGDALNKEFQSFPRKVHLLLSHTHWDHIQGLPFFSPLYRTECQMRILGREGARLGLGQILTEQMERPHFPISMNDLPGSISISEFTEACFRIGSVSVSTLQLNHPGGCTGYRLECDGAVVVYLTDNEPHSFGQREGGKGDESSAVWDANRALVDFVANANVAVMDAQYQTSEYRSRIGWGHGCVSDVVRIAAAGEVEQLFLFHHDPYHSDDQMDQLVADAKGLAESLESNLTVEAAREGLAVSLPGSVRHAATSPSGTKSA